MKNKIVSFGDSFVYGSELTNNDDGSKSWIAQAANRLGVEYVTLAIPGCGNEAITRQILSYFSLNPSDNVIAVINWTWGPRWDFYLSDVEQWITLGQTCVPSKLTRYVSAAEANKIIDFYQTYPGNSTLWDKFRSLQTISFSQQYLRSLNVPTIQTYMEAELWDRKWHAPDYIQQLQNLTHTSLETFEGKNFLDWSYDHGFAVTSKGLHPLEDAHKAACELWISRYAQALNS